MSDIIKNSFEAINGLLHDRVDSFSEAADGVQEIYDQKFPQEGPQSNVADLATYKSQKADETSGITDLNNTNVTEDAVISVDDTRAEIDDIFNEIAA